MAFLAELGVQVDELVVAVAAASGRLPNDLKGSRDAVVRTLRHNTFPRTNQFVVEEQLDGLEEKFSVAGRDGLAFALRERRDALQSCTTRWTPEILQFLLELSDQPTKKSRLENLALLRRSDEISEPSFRWDDIAKEDGWAADKAIWKSINYAENSEDEDYRDTHSDTSADSQETSISSTDTHHQRSARDLLLSEAALSKLDGIEQAQSWRDTETPRDSSGRALKVLINEFQLLREVLFMLQGLDNNLFEVNCIPNLKFQLLGTSWQTFNALLDMVSESGCQLRILRDYLCVQNGTPLMQVFHDCIRQRLTWFDRSLSSIEARYIDIDHDVPISVLAILEELKPSMRRLFTLSKIVQSLAAERNAHAFRYLELLFDTVCTAQSEGNGDIHEFIGHIFFECFSVYLRPIRKWMSEGELIQGDKTFFVSASSTDVPLNKIWQSKFTLRRTDAGVLHAPQFLQPAVSRIFNTGKSIVILKHLGRYQDPNGAWPATEPQLDFANVCPPGSELAPFAELFTNAFREWMKSKHHTASASLRRILFDSCGLWASLDALQILYLMSDGSCADAFTFPIFSYLDSEDPSWHDRFTLTGFVQEAYGARLDPGRLSAVVSEEDVQDDAVASKSVRNALTKIKLKYRLSWPVQMIISPDSIAQYDTLFTLLLQIRRATYTLNRHRILSEVTDVSRTDEAVLFFTVRSKLLWFCTTLHTYLTSLVLAPNISLMQQDLLNADDVDAMVRVHSMFCKQLTDEACLGAKLDPIRECMLDLFDLAIKLEDARRAEAIRQKATMQETSRLSIVASPPEDSLRQSRRGVYISPVEEEEAEMTFMDTDDEHPNVKTEDTYRDLLQTINADSDRYLRFVIGGLKGVARASSGATAGKWDVLAEMLEAGMRDQRDG